MLFNLSADSCLIGLLVTIITSFFIKFFHRQFLKWEYGNSTKTDGRLLKINKNRIFLPIKK